MDRCLIFKNYDTARVDRESSVWSPIVQWEMPEWADHNIHTPIFQLTSIFLNAAQHSTRLFMFHKGAHHY